MFFVVWILDVDPCPGVVPAVRPLDIFVELDRAIAQAPTLGTIIRYIWCIAIPAYDKLTHVSEKLVVCLRNFNMKSVLCVIITPMLPSYVSCEIDVRVLFNSDHVIWRPQAIEFQLHT